MVLNFGPLARKKLQDMCHAFFVMISYCCLFILQARALLGTLESKDVLELVGSVASLMIDVASNSNDTSLTCGKAILQRVERYKNGMPRRESVSRQADGEAELLSNQPVSINEWDTDMEGVRWSGNVVPDFNYNDDSIMNNLFNFSATFSEYFWDPA